MLFVKYDSSDLKQIFYGLLLIIIIAIIIILGNLRMGKYYSLTTRVTEIDSLKENAPVFYLDKQIGFVSNIQLNPANFNIIVTILIEEGVNLTNDSFLSIRGSGFFGSKYITIYPGNSDQMLKNGDQIIYSQGAINVEKFINILLDYAENQR